MYCLDGTYHNLVIYLDGYDAGSRDTALAGFREWLLLRLDRDSSLHWPSLAIELARPDLAVDSYRSFGPSQNEAAIAALFRLLAEFLADRDADRDGLRRIHAAFTTRFGR